MIDATSSRFLFHGGMRGFKLPQHLLPVQGFVWMAVSGGIPDVIADDPIDLHCTTQLVNQAATQLSGDDFRHMLMLSNGLDFLFLQVGQADAVVISQHDITSTIDLEP
ncbi:MAG TPA: hypothetical protein PKD21_06385, partial [Candidatus Competibacter phosphatis]|nr:hypothetical protein [Candidatus Competibacter phosphatis]